MRKLITVVVAISMLLVITETALAISPDIRANNSDVPITLETGDDLSITVALDSGGSSGTPADWWILATTPYGLIYFSPSGWALADSLSDIVAFQFPLANFSSFEVFKIPAAALPSLLPGPYTFYFAVDTTMNGLLDGPLYYDSVIVNVAFRSSSTLIPGQGFNTLNFSSNGVLNQILLYDDDLVYRTFDGSSGVLKEESVASISYNSYGCSGMHCFQAKNLPAALLMSSNDTPHILLAGGGSQHGNGQV